MKPLKILLIIFLLIGCQRSENKHSVLTENLKLKADFYQSINDKLNSGDSLFVFDNPTYQFDTLMIFPSYTPWEKVKPNLSDAIIEEYKGREMLRENEDLFLFKERGELLYYFTLDSLYAIPDLESKSFSYHRNTKFKVMTFLTNNSQRGGYLIPID